MEVKINKEIREYTEGIFLGLSLRQCFFSFLACVMAVIFYFLFIDHLGMEITSWLCMISAAPFAALGFIIFQGMNAEQIVICAIRSLLIKQHNLIFKPQNLYYGQQQFCRRHGQMEDGQQGYAVHPGRTLSL